MKSRLTGIAIPIPLHRQAQSDLQNINPVAEFVRIRFFAIEGSLKSYDFSYLGVWFMFT